MVGSNKAFVNAKEVSEMLGIGTSKAYMIIRRFNNELEQQGYLVIPGRCPRKYFEQKIYGYAECYQPPEDLPIVEGTDETEMSCDADQVIGLEEQEKEDQVLLSAQVEYY